MNGGPGGAWFTRPASNPDHSPRLFCFPYAGGGASEEVLEHPELKEIMSQLPRADFEVVETYSYVPEPPLDCPVTVFGGLRDHDVGRDVLEPRREQTTSRFSLRMLPGGHFFLQSDRHLLPSPLSEELRRALPEGGREHPNA